MDEFVCPGCTAHLTQRQLRMTSVVTESCPHCGTVVRQGDAFRWENVEARTAEDVDAVGSWLSEECQQLRQNVQAIRDREASGEYVWRVMGDLLSGCPENWVIEVTYSTRAPGIIAVQIMAAEAELLDDGLLRSFIGVFLDHALQPHGSRQQSSGIAGSQQVTQWGARQYLGTDPLAQGLLRPVVIRLVTAMRDAITTRGPATG